MMEKHNRTPWFLYGMLWYIIQLTAKPPNKNLHVIRQTKTRVTSGLYQNSWYRQWLLEFFYWFLRPSECCITSSGHELKTGDINITDSQITLTLTTLKHSKGQVMVRINKVAGPANPVYRVSKYLKVCCETVNTFFHASYKTFCDEFASVAVVAGLQDNVTPHALRRGGATWASLQGWSDSRIRAHGRWSSGAFKKYIVLRWRIKV